MASLAGPVRDPSVWPSVWSLLCLLGDQQLLRYRRRFSQRRRRGSLLSGSFARVQEIMSQRGKFLLYGIVRNHLNRHQPPAETSAIKRNGGANDWNVREQWLSSLRP